MHVITWSCSGLKVISAVIIFIVVVARSKTICGTIFSNWHVFCNWALCSFLCWRSAIPGPALGLVARGFAATLAFIFVPFAVIGGFNFLRNRIAQIVTQLRADFQAFLLKGPVLFVGYMRAPFSHMLKLLVIIDVDGVSHLLVVGESGIQHLLNVRLGGIHNFLLSVHFTFMLNAAFAQVSETFPILQAVILALVLL